MGRQESIEGLVSLGFTELEAEVYLVLLERSPATGYRVAQEAGKAVANVYKALESLQNKGAVLVDDGGNRFCRAVPAEELLSRLERSFQERKMQTLQALAALGGSPSDDRVYQLRTSDQVLERCRNMLERSKEVVLLDIFPKPLEMLRSDLTRAAKRGVTVGAYLYQPAKVTGVRTFLQPLGESTLKRWPGQWVNLVLDGTEHLMAFLTSDGKGVHQAVWSSSAYLSWIFHCGVSSGIMFAALRELIEKNAPVKEFKKTLNRNRDIVALQALGYKTLLRRFGGKK